jgi:hypothetical protein
MRSVNPNSQSGLRSPAGHRQADDSAADDGQRSPHAECLLLPPPV